jgi:KaiC/GvpD/RAD55 family RecA-like ATPase
MTNRARVSTGDETLDGMLGGGLPRNRATLVTGGPGTGKSTLAMQFLQAGLAAGETALFVSTEQTVQELHDSFSGFEFDLDDQRLSFLTVHAAPGQTFDGDGHALTIQRLGRGPDATLQESNVVVPDENGDGAGPGGGVAGGDNLGRAEVGDDGAEPTDADPDGDPDPGTVQEDPVDHDPGSFAAAFARPFDRENLLEYLRPHGPCDRVVFDSVSGLSAVSEGSELFRRTVLDLVRFFSDEFGATSLFTAQANAGDAESRLPQFTTHGVIELQRAAVEDDLHRFLRITKMRGVDHDRRRVELEFVPSGIRVAPVRRSQPPALKTHAHRPIGIEGLDSLCGGGLVSGAGVLLVHDGRANLTALFGTLIASALEAGDDVTLVPTVGLREDRVRTLLEGHGLDLEELLATGRVGVVDLIGGWDQSLPNVVVPEKTVEGIVDRLRDVGARNGNESFTLYNADTVVHALGVDGAREVRYVSESALLGRDDTLIHVLNPNTVPETASAFYQDVAEQVLETWIGNDGLQYVTLRKSPCGFVGSTSLVEYIHDPPYLRVQGPPGAQKRTNPAATGED